MNTRLSLHIDRFSEINIEDGGFAFGLNYWEQRVLENFLPHNSLYQIINGTAFHLPTHTQDYLFQTKLSTVGTYKVSYTLVGWKGTVNARVRIGGVYGPLRTAGGEYVDYITVTNLVDGRAGVVMYGNSLGGLKKFKVERIDNYSYEPDLMDDFNIPITYDFLSLGKLEERRTPYSKSFTIPGTKKNNDIFNHIYELATEDSNFKLNVSNFCYVYHNDIQIFSGKFEMQKVKNVYGSIEYYCQIFGTPIHFAEAVGTKLLTGNDNPMDDVDFSHYNHILDKALVVSSWDNVGPTGYTYPLADYANLDTKTDINIRDLRPCLFIKEIWDKIFESNRFTYTSTFLNSNIFKNLVMPACQVMLLSEEEITKRGFLGTVTSYDETHLGNCVYDPTNSIATVGPFKFKTNFTDPAYYGLHDLTNQYNSIDQSVTISRSGKYEIGAAARIHWWIRNTGIQMIKWDSDKLGYYGELYVRRWNVVSQTLETISYDYIEDFMNNSDDEIEPGTDNALTVTSIFSGAETVELNTGDRLWIEVAIKKIFPPSNHPNNAHQIRMQLQRDNGDNELGTFLRITALKSPIFEGDLVDVNRVLPQDTKQIDFLNSLCSMFNLVIERNPDKEYDLIIEPFDTYYGMGSTLDWTDKIDETDGYEFERPQDFIDKDLYLSYQEDTDYYNDLFRETYKRNYGDSKIFNSKDIKIDNIFAPTIFGYHKSSNLIIPKFYQLSPDGALLDEQILRPRIQNLVRIPYPTTANSIRITSNTVDGTYYIVGSGNTTTPQYTTYVTMNHYDNPYNSTYDINFGAMDAYYAYSQGTEDNLWNKYWYNRYWQIKDEDARLVTYTIKLSTQDIFNLRFYNTILIDNIYYHIHRIVEYIPDNLCTIELLKTFVVKRPKKPRPIPIWIKPNVVRPVLDIINDAVVGSGTTIISRAGDNSASVDNGIMIKAGVMTAYDTIIDGGEDEVQNPFSSDICNIVDGGKDCIREYGSFKPNNIIEST